MKNPKSIRTLFAFPGFTAAIIEYDIPSIDRQGIVSIKRVAADNVALRVEKKLRVGFRKVQVT